MLENNSQAPHHFLFMLGMLFFLGTLSLLGFVVYLIPHVLFNWHYRMPDFVYGMQDWLQDKYALSDGMARLSEFFLLLIIAGIMGGVAYALSRWAAPPMIGQEALATDQDIAAKTAPKEGVWVTVKLIAILAVLLVVILFFQWLFFGNSPSIPE